MVPLQVSGAEGANWLGLLGFAALLALFGVIFLVVAILPDRREKAAFRKLASRRGWRVAHRPGQGGRGSIITIRPGAGEGWHAEIRRYQSASLQIRTVEFRSKTPALTQGLVAIGPSLSAAQAGMTGSMIASMPIGLRDLLFGGSEYDSLAPQAAGLRLAPSIQVEGGSVFTAGAPDAFTIAEVYAPLLRQWRVTAPDSDTFPVLILSSQGLRLRVRRDLDADRVEALIDLGAALADGVTP